MGDQKSNRQRKQEKAVRKAIKKRQRAVQNALKSRLRAQGVPIRREWNLGQQVTARQPVPPLLHNLPRNWQPPMDHNLPITGDEFYGRHEFPRLAGERITESNVQRVLGEVNVSAAAQESTQKAIKAIGNVPGMMVEAREGRLIATSGGLPQFELPVFGEANILTRGGTRHFTIKNVTTIGPSGMDTKSFANWFNTTIENLANTTGSVRDKQNAISDQISKIFGQLGKDGDGARAMVEPLGAVGRPRLGQAAFKGEVTAFMLSNAQGSAGADAVNSWVAMSEKASEVFRKIHDGHSVKGLIEGEESARRAFLEEFYKVANSTRPGTTFSDSTFSVTAKAILDPLQNIDVETGGIKGIAPMLTELQPRDLMLFGDESTAMKGFSQIRHASFITHDKMGRMNAHTRQTRQGVPSAIRADRMTPVVQTRARFEMDVRASAVEGKAGTFAPMGKVAAFVDPAMADAFLKDSGGIRSNLSHINDPNFSTMGQFYTKKMSVKSADEILAQGMFSPKIRKMIEQELQKRGARHARQTMEFGSFAAQHLALGQTVEGGHLGYSYSTSTESGMPATAEQMRRKAVGLDSADDVIEGIRIRDGQIEIAARRAGHRGSALGSLLVGESGKRITAGRTMNIRTERGGFDVLAHLEMFDQADDGTFTLATGKSHLNNKGGDFYRRQFQTIASRVEKRFGTSGLQRFGEAFGLTTETRFGASPTLVAEPGNTLNYGEGLARFKESLRSLGNGSTQDEARLNQVFDELTKVDIQKLDRGSVKRLLTERRIITSQGIYDPQAGDYKALTSIEGEKILETYRNQMKVAIFDDIIVERQDRVTSVGIKADGRSAAQLKASRLGYVREAIFTRGMNASPAAAKALQDFNDLVINEGMVKSNPVIFDEMRRLAAPFRGGVALGTGKSAKQIVAERGGGLGRSALETFKSQSGAKAPFPMHMLKNSFYHDAETGKLSKKGVTLDLGHEVALASDRLSGIDGEMPRSVKTNKIHIPSPAAVLNTQADDAIFLPKTGMPGSYVNLIEEITAQSQTEGPLTKAAADKIARLYNAFSIDFAEQSVGKDKAISKAALDPSFARYGALSSMPELMGDEVGLTRESFDEMLKKSHFTPQQKANIVSRAEGGTLKVGFLADPMGTREHYRGVSLRLFDDTKVAVPTPGGTRPSTKAGIYVSESLLKIANRDLDADHATISLLSSVSEHVKAMAEPGSRDLIKLEQEALEHMFQDQKIATAHIEATFMDKLTGSFKSFFDRGGELHHDLDMKDDLNLSGRVSTIDEAVEVTTAKSAAGIKTPIPEVWWQRQSGVANLVYQKRLDARANNMSKGQAIKEVVNVIMDRAGKERTEISRTQINSLISSMFESGGNASQFHNAIKYGFLLKQANREAGKSEAAMEFWGKIQQATDDFKSNQKNLSTATRDLDGLTHAILDVMVGGELVDVHGNEVTNMTVATASDEVLNASLVHTKHPVGYAISQQGPREFARVTARELVAGSLVSDITGFKNPFDIVAKDGDNLLGRGQGMEGRSSLQGRSGVIPESTAYQDAIEGVRPGYNIMDEMAESATEAGRATAREAIDGMDTTSQRRRASSAGARQTAEAAADQAAGMTYEEAKAEFGKFKDDMLDMYNKLSPGGKKNLKIAGVVAGGAIAIEAIRSTVSSFTGPGNASPTAPMPPQPLLNEPNDPTFDSRALPPHNRTRVQRTSGMRTHTQVSAQADFPLDLNAIPGAPVGAFNSSGHTSGTIRDGRNNQAMLDEEARRRLYAAY